MMTEANPIQDIQEALAEAWLNVQPFNKILRSAFHFPPRAPKLEEATQHAWRKGTWNPKGGSNDPWDIRNYSFATSEDLVEAFTGQSGWKEGTDYAVDERAGFIYREPNGKIEPGATVNIDYTWTPKGIKDVKVAPL